LVALTIQVNRDPKPRRTDLMIAAIASAHGLAFYTRNAADLVGLEDMLQIIEV
jgi:toxin FitB